MLNEYMHSPLTALYVDAREKGFGEGQEAADLSLSDRPILSTRGLALGWWYVNIV